VSATTDASKLLRRGLLDGVRVLVAGPVGEAGTEPHADDREESAGMAAAVASTCASLGADVSRATPGEACPADVDLLVIDGAGLFAAVARDEDGGRDARLALSTCLDGAWEATRAVAGPAFIDAGRAGRVIYLAPPSGAGAAHDATHADAARAGLENLARTLSIEWARYGVTLVTIAPGAQTPAAEVALVSAFLGSPAGAYYSGCQLDLRGLGGEPAHAAGLPVHR
jgi:NAD(P)-dependent dehydrogenase (short-subunit alcohol dehydrogenase family)